MKNREPMSDAQRRAMFARLHGGGGSRAGVPASDNSVSAHSQPLGQSGSSETRLDSQQVLDSLFSSPQDSTIPSEFLIPGASADSVAGQLADKSNSEAAIQTALLFSGGLGRIPAVTRAIASLGPVGKIISSWKTPAISALTSLGIGTYREKNPTMDPRTDKTLAIAQQISSYAAAMTGLGAAKGTIGALAPKQVSKATALLAKLGEKLSAAGSYVAENIPAKIKAPLAKVHAGYTKISDITGASWADLKNVPTIAANLKKAGSLRDAAAAARRQADEIVSAANDLKIVEQNKATDILHASHKGSLADWESAQRMYGEGASKFYAAEYGHAASMKTARLMREQAARMEEQAAQMTSDAQMSAVKGALVVAGFTTKEITEEGRIRDYQNQMEAAFAHGDSFTLPAEQPRGALGTAAAFVTGTLGNPIEKQTRYGADAYAAQVANYRVKYDAIGRAEQSGEISPPEAEKQRADLAASDKPWNMAGKGPWTFAPAAAAYLSWQAQNIAETLHRTSIDTVKPGGYMDGDTVNLTQHSGPNSIRLLDINAPEVAHDNSNDPNHPERKTGELFGQAAADYARSLLPDGQTVRVVLDSHKKAAGKEVHGRQLASLETLPAPFDKLLNIPVVGKLIPAQEFQTQMIKAGLADIHYRSLSGPTDVQAEHDAARAIAQAAGNNIWSQEGQAALPWVGTEKTKAQVIADKNAARARAADNAGLPPPPVPPTEDPSGIGNIFGAGLMVAGNTGTFKPMGDAGTAIAQLWNATLAGFGVREYNLKALEHPDPIVYRPPPALKTDYEKHAETVLKKRRKTKPASAP